MSNEKAVKGWKMNCSGESKTLLLTLGDSHVHQIITVQLAVLPDISLSSW